MIAKWTVVLLSASILSFHAQSASLSRGEQGLITNPQHADALMSVVENAIWAVDGEKADKQVYVVYSTECGWSQKLFADSRDLTNQVQFRWIAAAGRGADKVTLSKDSATIEAAFSGAQGRAEDAALGKRGVEYNYAVMNSTARQLKHYGAGDSFAFPTLIYRTAEGVRVIVGNPKELQSVVQEVSSIPAKSNLTPGGSNIIAAAVSTVKTPRLKEYINRNTQDTAVYAFPDKAAPQVHFLPKDYQLPVSGVTDNKQWIEVLPWGTRGPKAYIADPTEARLATLVFQVKRSSGNLVAQNADLKIHSHPDTSSPVLDTLAKGYQMNKTGEVTLDGKVWDEIQLYTDGTKGYIIR